MGGEVAHRVSVRGARATRIRTRRSQADAAENRNDRFRVPLPKWAPAARFGYYATESALSIRATISWLRPSSSLLWSGAVGDRSRQGVSYLLWTKASRSCSLLLGRLVEMISSRTALVIAILSSAVARGEREQGGGALGYFSRTCLMKSSSMPRRTSHRHRRSPRQERHEEDHPDQETPDAPQPALPPCNRGSWASCCLAAS